MRSKHDSLRFITQAALTAVCFAYVGIIFPPISSTIPPAPNETYPSDFLDRNAIVFVGTIECSDTIKGVKGDSRYRLAHIIKYNIEKVYKGDVTTKTLTVAFIDTNVHDLRTRFPKNDYGFPNGFKQLIGASPGTVTLKGHEVPIDNSYEIVDFTKYETVGMCFDSVDIPRNLPVIRNSLDLEYPSDRTYFNERVRQYVLERLEYKRHIQDWIEVISKVRNTQGPSSKATDKLLPLLFADKHEARASAAYEILRLRGEIPESAGHITRDIIKKLQQEFNEKAKENGIVASAE